MTDIDAAVHALGGETNKVIYDDIGMPSIVVEVKETIKILDDIVYGTSTLPHPAFVVNGVRKSKFYVSKYQNVVLNERAYSLPLQVPELKMNFDASISACAKKGLGWHLMTNAEWAYLALVGYLPRGNNNSGSDYRGAERGGIRTEKADRSLTEYILTGSGPAAYAHNGESSGIWDLNGNKNEWVGGLRLMDGEIQIIKDNDAADFTVSQCPSSEHWKSIIQDSSLVPFGTAETIKLDYTKEPVAGETLSMILAKNLINQQTDASLHGERAFKSLESRAGFDIPHILKLLAIAPWDTVSDGYIFMKNIGERPAVRGGGATDGNKAGIRTLGLNNLRDLNDFAFRSAYIDILDTAILADESGVALATEDGIIKL
ncbi:MAG: hypothetical protein E7671_00480 [Ruminococcaceae bacterium]|nr:hypothetical protein [Oscillospiraceae bacterium]